MVIYQRPIVVFIFKQIVMCILCCEAQEQYYLKGRSYCGLISDFDLMIYVKIEINLIKFP